MTVTNHILKAAFDLFMKYGVRSVSMDDLADNLGMSKKTIYAEIETKEKLICKVIKIHLSQDEKQIKKIIKSSGDAIEEMVSISQHIMQFLMQIKPSLIFDLKKFYPKCWELIEKQHFTFIRATIQQNIIRGQKENLYRPDINPDIIAKLYVAQSNTIVNADIFPLTEYDLLDLIRQMETSHLHGLVTEKGKQKLSTLSFYKL